MKKKIALLFISAALALTSLTPAFAVSIISIEPIKVILNDKLIEFDQDPIIENNRTLVPFRNILEAMGADISWDAETKTITCTKGDKIIKITIGADEMLVNDEVVVLEVPAKIIEGRTFIPLRAISENFNADVNWISNERIINIKTNEDISEENTSGSSIKEISSDFESKVLPLCSELENAIYVLIRSKDLLNLDSDKIKEYNKIAGEISSFLNNLEIKTSLQIDSTILEINALKQKLYDFCDENKIDLKGLIEYANYYDKLFDLAEEIMAANNLGVLTEDVNKKIDNAIKDFFEYNKNTDLSKYDLKKGTELAKKAYEKIMDILKKEGLLKKTKEQ